MTGDHTTALISCGGTNLSRIRGHCNSTTGSQNVMIAHFVESLLKLFICRFFHHQSSGLSLMSAVRVVDNTLATIIASAVGGAIALIMGFMLLKNFTLFVLTKMEEKK